MDYVLEQYELIYGELPKNKPGTDYSTEMLLVVGSGNKITINILNDLGYEVIGYDDNKNHEFTEDKLIERGIKIYTDENNIIDENTIVIGCVTII